MAGKQLALRLCSLTTVLSSLAKISQAATLQTTLARAAPTNLLRLDLWPMPAAIQGLQPGKHLETLEMRLPLAMLRLEVARAT